MTEKYSFKERMTGMKKCPGCRQREILLEVELCEDCLESKFGKKAQPVVEELAVENRETEEQGDLPMKWFGVYLRVLLPLNFFIVLLLTMFANPISIIDLVMVGALFVGLYQRKLWGWKLNFVVLVLGAILNSIKTALTADPPGFSMMGFMVGFIIFGAYAYFNWIYFMKRKDYFNK